VVYRPSNQPRVNDGPDPRLLTALTTEHFTLQGARSQTVSESSARSALYLGSVSSGLVALGFVGQFTGGTGELFDVFALVILPTLFFLGLFTFVRLVESSIEDIRYGRAINRIRHYYLELAGDESRYFLMSAHDDPLGVLANMGLTGGSRWQLYFTTATAVAVVNSVVGGSALALAAAVATGAPLGVAVAVGALFAIGSILAHNRWDRQRHMEGGAGDEVLFPSEPPQGSSRPSQPS
jgi:hypothetical protein